MDTLVVNSKFMRGVINHIINRAIKKDAGYNANVDIADLKITSGDGDDSTVKLDLKIHVDMPNDDFKRLIFSSLLP